jgi:hypothetical protein
LMILFVNYIHCVVSIEKNFVRSQGDDFALRIWQEPRGNGAFSSHFRTVPVYFPSKPVTTEIFQSISLFFHRKR